MAKKEQSVLAIDIGGASLKMAEFSYPEAGGVVLEKFAFHDFSDRDADPVEAFSEAYRQLLTEHGFKAKNVCLSISGQSSFSRLAKLPPLIGNSASIKKIIEYEAKQLIPYPMEEVVWGSQLISHVQTVERTVEPEEPGGEPIVEVEETEDFEALIVAVKIEQVTAYTDIIQDSGKEIMSVDIAPVAMFNAAKASQCAGDESVLLLNIGGRSSNLVIADSGRVFVRSIPIAGDTITQLVAKEFGIAFAEAEELKRRQGFVALGGAYEEPESEVAATISKIARNVMTRLHGEINRSINVWRSQHGGNQPKQMLLSGGGSLMFYTQEFFHEKLRIPIDYLNVFSTVSLGAEVDRQKLLDVAPMFPELIGMSLHSVTTCPVDISLIPKSIEFQKSFQRKKIYFYISAGSVVLCLLIFLSAIMHRTSYSMSLVSQTKGGVEETQKMQDRIKKMMGELGGVKSQYQEAADLLKPRGKWFDMLEELQSIMPDTMYIVALEGVGTEIAPTAAAAPDQSDPGSLFGPMDAPQPGSQPAASLPEVKKFERKKAELISEVKELRLRFYMLVLDNDLAEDEFRAALKKSKHFSDADDGFVIEAFESGSGKDNLKAYTALIKLKEPIKK
ncbi:MAG: pilus assembly protein PilM [Victivallaceae bacterium]